MYSQHRFKANDWLTVHVYADRSLYMTLYSYANFASDKVLDKSANFKFQIEIHIKEQNLYLEDRVCPLL